MAQGPPANALKAKDDKIVITINSFFIVPPFLLLPGIGKSLLVIDSDKKNKRLFGKCPIFSQKKALVFCPITKY